MPKSKRYVLLISMLASAVIFSFWKIGCDPVHGTAKIGSVEYALNAFKNRKDVPVIIDTTITLHRILQKGNDSNRFKNTKAATISGYVVLVKLAGPESCNCNKKEEALRDVHVELAENRNETDHSKMMVVEMTPSIRAQNGWTLTGLKTLLGNQVEITGWMMFDVVHADVALNTASQDVTIQRATAWEVHPVTSFQIKKSK